LLTLLTLIHASGKGRFPEGGRAGLYEETVKLLNRWDPPYEKPALIEKVEGLNLVRLREALQVLAYEVHRDQVSHRGTANIGRAKLLQVIDDYQSGGEIFVSQLGAPSDAIVEYLESRNGILLANSHEFFRFPHRSFQEFMAACALWENYDKCVLPNSATKVHVEEWTFPENIVVLLRSDFERWREVALLIGARLVAQRSFDQWWRLIDQLLPSHAANYADVTSAALDDNNWRCLLLSGEIWLEHKLEPKVVSQRTILNSLKESINVLIKNVVLTPVERNRAAEVLAVLGDDRSGVGLDSNGVPDVRLVDIPPGSFWMGSNRSPEEQPPHQVIVPHGFRISSYPVTNLQFEAFLKAKDGYCQTQWWDFSESARIWRRQVGSKQPVHSDLVALQNHPRVNVTWHEAVAFCRWLSNHTGLNFRLPTESEWEYVARGNDQREYPWGNVFDVNRCNMRETGIGTTSAVGIFGDSNYAFKEVYDLSGNVEEWCLTSWTEIGAYPYISGDGRNLLTEATPRVLRGGSFLSRKERVTTTARPGGAIDSQSKYIGFRVVVSGKAIERTGMNL
jgi:formylglycine-generating enzyme required for sulfatase activity